MKRAASQRADRVIVAADKSKLGRVTFVQHRARCPTIDIIVTDGSRDHPALVAARGAASRSSAWPGTPTSSDGIAGGQA